jgi:hypothetical protein
VSSLFLIRLASFASKPPRNTSKLSSLPPTKRRPHIHDIDALLEMCATVDIAFDSLRPLVEGLTEFAVIFRYPGEWSDMTTASQALTQAEQVRALVREKLNLVEGNG